MREDRVESKMELSIMWPAVDIVYEVKAGAILYGVKES